MCFTATASFPAGATRCGVGMLTLKSAMPTHRRSALPFAAIASLSAIQPPSAGVIWLTLTAAAWVHHRSMTFACSFFSHVWWPSCMPWAVWRIEPPRQRRRLLLVFTAVGFAVAAYLRFSLFAPGAVSKPTGPHIESAAPHFDAARTIPLSLRSTTTSPLFSNHRTVKVFGALAFLASAAVYFYAQWFISVCCLFAARSSAVICLHVALPRDDRTAAARAVTRSAAAASH